MCWFVSDDFYWLNARWVHTEFVLSTHWARWVHAELTEFTLSAKYSACWIIRCQWYFYRCFGLLYAIAYDSRDFGQVCYVCHMTWIFVHAIHIHHLIVLDVISFHTKGTILSLMTFVCWFHNRAYILEGLDGYVLINTRFFHTSIIFCNPFKGMVIRCHRCVFYLQLLVSNIYYKFMTLIILFRLISLLYFFMGFIYYYCVGSITLIDYLCNSISLK